MERVEKPEKQNGRILRYRENGMYEKCGLELEEKSSVYPTVKLF